MYNNFSAMINRREFIKTSAAVVGTLAAYGAGAMIKPTISNVGLQVWSIAKFLEKNFEGSLKELAAIGYKELELYGPYPFSTQHDKDSWKAGNSMLGFTQSGYFDRSVTAFKEALATHGLSTPAMHVGLDTLRNKLEETAEAAHQLGQEYAGIAYLPAENRKTPDDWKRTADEFNNIGRKAKSLGIKFYYHNHGYGLKPVNGKVPFEIIVENTDPSLVFFEMDIFWTTAGGADPVKYLDRYPGRYKLMHVKDMTKRVQFSGDGGSPTQWVELFPQIADAGKGVLDIKAIVQHARKSGVDHFIVENDAIVNPTESLNQGYKYLSALL